MTTPTYDAGFGSADDPTSDFVPLPMDFTGTDWPDASAYAEDVADVLGARQRAYAGDNDVPGDLRARIADQIRDDYDKLPGLFPAHLHYLYWPEPTRPPVPVFVGFWPVPDSGRAPAERLGKADVEEEFTSEHLGRGTRSLYGVALQPDDGDDDAANVAPFLGVVGYHWRAGDTPIDVQLIAMTNELGRLYAALPALDAFARELTVYDGQ
ncbi:hypothetical protein AB5L52_18740 [Streptomyces sp. CG4]|uniref:hypothetical protein n=1 Tax=Streptomyces sp. CG4 TaxID=408783 RepID=UPI0034E22623